MHRAVKSGRIGVERDSSTVHTRVEYGKRKIVDNSMQQVNRWTRDSGFGKGGSSRGPEAESPLVWSRDKTPKRSNDLLLIHIL